MSASDNLTVMIWDCPDCPTSEALTVDVFGAVVAVQVRADGSWCEVHDDQPCVHVAAVDRAAAGAAS